MTKETIKSARVARKPLTQRGPQAIAGTKDSDFEYRFVNDTGSRIHNFQTAGYELVAVTISLLGIIVSDASDLGSAKRVISNDGTTSYLMRVRRNGMLKIRLLKLLLLPNKSLQ